MTGEAWGVRLSFGVAASDHVHNRNFRLVRAQWLLWFYSCPPAPTAAGARVGGHATASPRMGQSRYARSTWARLGWRSLASVLDSIWRIPSLVPPNSRPTPSSVFGCPAVSPHPTWIIAC